jgi:hypothetical protein
MYMYTEREASGSCQQNTCQRLPPTVVNRLWIRKWFQCRFISRSGSSILGQCGSGSKDSMTKNGYILQVKKIHSLSSRPPRTTSKLHEKPPGLKKNIQHFKKNQYISFCDTHFAHLDPADQNQCGSMRFRIHNTIYQV